MPPVKSQKHETSSWMTRLMSDQCTGWIETYRPNQFLLWLIVYDLRLKYIFNQNNMWRVIVLDEAAPQYQIHNCMFTLFLFLRYVWYCLFIISYICWHVTKEMGNITACKHLYYNHTAQWSEQRYTSLATWRLTWHTSVQSCCFPPV